VLLAAALACARRRRSVCGGTVTREVDP
jgi:hypothetical protein